MDAPALQIFRGDDCAGERLPVRGVGWVLRWAATLAVLAVSALILVAFAYQLAAERALARAAAAGLREATCERATNRSVEAVVRRQLAGRFDLHRATTIELQQNGSRVRGALRPQGGDRLSITLSAPAIAALPRWLQIVSWNERAEITQRADQRIGNSEAARPLMFANRR
jgi:hypothetical protein